MNNKKGKLFGKFNIIDLIVIVLIICVAAFVVMKFSDGGIGSATSTSRVQMTVYQEDSADFVPPNTQIGDPVYDANSKVTLGTVTDIQTGSSVFYIENADGTTTISSREGYCSVNITIEGSGTVSDHGVTIDGILYGVGHTMVIYAGMGKYYVQIYSIEPLE